ncbi:MAG: hypothetical protein AAF483_21605 [Planctomycetota bacterium]
MDGMSWTFTGSIGGREIDAGGDNASRHLTTLQNRRPMLTAMRILCLRSIVRSAYRYRTMSFTMDSVSPL